ncbi:MAG: response regulator, partial [Gammaproteobacteria bacterium]|nr:response regulator [Gammaproteobacteria bacterium]
AHDFNNILGIILGYSELAMARSTSRGDAKQAKQLELVLKASERAKGLVAKMLAFSRSEASNDKPLLLQSILMEDIKMLRSTLPSSIQISTEIDENLPAILMDPVQLNQLLMNLCVNARDAMEGKGNINIRLAWSREMEGECVACRKRIEGDWVELSITDTGSGIKPDVLDRIFDPFYTTKDVGKGTGMGLSVIHGILRNHGGHVLVETEIGKGSTFRLLFPPAIEEIAKTPGVDRSSEKLPHGRGEHVLVLDDEQDLGEYLGDLLESYGFRVTVLTSSKEALELFKEKPDEFAILITDQTMPGMTGVALVNAIREIRPNMPSILNTGFSDDIDAETATGMGIGYLEKPVMANSLLQKIDELIRSKKQSTE